MSIEEARRLVLEQARIVAGGLDHPETILAAADAYALAVLDHFPIPCGGDVCRSVVPHPICDEAIALRRRIEELL